MLNTKIKDLSIKPTKEQIAYLLKHESKPDLSPRYNLYWDIKTGKLRYDHYTQDTYGIPVFQNGLADLVSHETDVDFIERSLAVANFRRVDKLFAIHDFKPGMGAVNQVSAIIAGKGFSRGLYLIEEMEQEDLIWILNQTIYEGSAEEASKLVNCFTDEQLHLLIPNVNAYAINLYPLLNPMKTVHIELAARMMENGIVGKHLNEQQTAVFIEFVNAVVDLQQHNLLNADATDVVLRLLKNAQHIEYTVNTETKFLLAKTSTADDVNAAIDRARATWLLNE